MNKCKDCKYCDFKDKWNGEDYTRTYYCSKRHKIRFLLRKGYKHYEKYIPKHYVEQFTKCDRCEYLSECKNTIDITMPEDTQRHFMRDWSGRCKKYEEKLVGVKLSEVLTQLVDNKSSGEIINRAIEIYGDITYGELINDKNKLNTVYDSFKESI